ncbi:MAG: Bax inhibitor-1/YccA family protein [Flavobacteriales bacterium]|nr:Bax inhibitor-1/YccA family protein [Flavobacteriales bacterium]MCB9181988.1 Bax inhibitor-1/YccA family protein [Flavobacteriales bacterium]MCB9200440.1 Bax inhibitor-1/YccA family protein [Flavobacteriales bacterium]HOP44083.1 Bax inhibitor-1/YccA family protein [Flavobacteriales bacterium]HOP44680.1 Bax inhibitor-1/YccA family protein [Flavobacteriales bacterium]
MDQHPIPGTYQEQAIELAPANVRTFLANVFSYMTLALVISGAMAWWFGHDLALLQYLINFETGKQTILGWVVLLAPLGLVFLMGGMVERLSGPALFAIYLVYSAVTGISLSYIFLIYAASSIATVFFITAGLFSVMAIAGYTTSTDLTKLGSILFIGLIGIIIASVVNMFLGSGTMDYIISILGVIIFTGLTAYDVQKLKRMGGVVATGTETAQKMALMGALSLYLDFINLFLMLLRLFGRRD